MKTFLLAKGKAGVLVGDPSRAGRWAGQRRVHDNPVKSQHERYKPCWTAHEYGNGGLGHLSKALKRGELADLVKVRAASMADALAQAPKSHSPKKGDGK